MHECLSYKITTSHYLIILPPGALPSGTVTVVRFDVGLLPGNPWTLFADLAQSPSYNPVHLFIYEGSPHLVLNDSTSYICKIEAGNTCSSVQVFPTSMVHGPVFVGFTTHEVAGTTPQSLAGQSG